MSGEHASFAAWLREHALAAGIDLDVRGGPAKLASLSGVDPAQMSRAVRGLHIPAIEGQRGLARALGVPVLEVLVASGYLRGEDIAEAFKSWQGTGTDMDLSQYTAAAPEPDIANLAAMLEIPAEQRPAFDTLVRRLADIARDVDSSIAVTQVLAIVEALLNTEAATGRMDIQKPRPVDARGEDEAASAPRRRVVKRPRKPDSPAD